MIKIEIDGNEIEVEQGSMIIEAADKAGIKIPRFCYHSKLSIAANCRMCLVDVEKAPKPLPACATPATDGMKVKTQSNNATEAQKGVMEFLLINHPLDCPICDQGGECELQDVALGYGKDVSRYQEGKRVVIDKNIGPLIATDLTRCIHCTRCVRFGAEVAGIRELGATGRGENMSIGTYIEKSVDSEVSGNVIDLCPVGALTSKPFRFKARPWELRQYASLAPHDCVGTNIYVHTRRQEVMRVVPKDNENINEVWLSDRDRFSYEGLTHDDRLYEPMVKVNREWQTIAWSDALDMISEKLTQITEQYGASSIGAVVSPSATTEEYFLLQKLFRSMGSNNIDHRTRQTDFREQDMAPIFPSLGNTFLEFEDLNGVLLVGSDIHREQPLLGIRLRKMVLNGGKAFVINPASFDFNFEITQECVSAHADMLSDLAGIAKSMLDMSSSLVPTGAAELLQDVKPEERHQLIARELLEARTSSVVLGALALSHPDCSRLLALSRLIAILSEASFGCLTEGANAAGAWIAGCVPHRRLGGESITTPGFTIEQMWENPLKAYWLQGIEPHLDCADGHLATKALDSAEFVVSLSAYRSDYLESIADVLLPLAPFTETEGTYINATGEWQTIKPVMAPPDEVKPGWKVYRYLANKLDLEGFDYNQADEILAEVRQSMMDKTSGEWVWWCPKELKTRQGANGFVRIAPVSIYHIDPIVRRAKSLQKTKAAGKPVVLLNTEMAKRCGLTKTSLAEIQGQDKSIKLPVAIDDGIPNGCLLINSGQLETVALGKPYSELDIKQG